MLRKFLVVMIIVTVQLVSMHGAYAEVVHNSNGCSITKSNLDQHLGGSTVVFDQTKKRKERLFINTLLAVITGSVAGIKLATGVCGTGYTTSYYIYNGADLVYGLAELNYYLSKKEESNVELKANLSEDLNPQLEAFQKAYEEQMKAYNKAKDKVDFLKTLKTARYAAIGIAVGEGIIQSMSWMGGLTFICLPTGEYSAMAAKAALVAAIAGGISIVASDNKDAAMKSATSGTVTYKKEINELSKSLFDDALKDAGEEVTKAFQEEVVKEAGGDAAGATVESLPYTRAAFYGAMELIAAALGNDTEDSANCMKQRADEYLAMKTNLENALVKSNPTARQTGTVQTHATTYTPSDESMYDQNNFAGCSKLTSQGIQNDSSCSCRSTNSCFKVNQPNYAQMQKGLPFNIPSPLKTATDTSADYINSIASGNMAGAQSAANKLNSNALANNLKKVNDAMMKEYNKIRAKSGKKPLNLNADSKKLYDRLYKKTKKSLAKKGITDFDSLRNYVQTGDANKAKSGDNKEEIAKAESYTAPAVAAAQPSGSNNKEKEAAPLFDLFADESTNTQQEMVDKTPTQEEALEQFEVNEGGIIKRPDVSIWKVLSSRYIRKYDAFFEKK